MSREAIRDVREHSRLPGGLRAVELVVADIVNPRYEWALWADMERLAHDAGVSVKTVRRALDAMVAAGRLEVLQSPIRGFGGGRWKWVFHRQAMDNLSTTTPRAMDNLSTGNGQSVHCSGVTPFIEQLTEQKTPCASLRESAADTPLPLAGLSTDPAPPVDKPRKARPPDLLWEALTEACGMTGPYTPKARASVNAALKELRAVDATPDEIRRRALAYQAQFPNANLTPHALCKWWPSCATVPVPRPNGNGHRPSIDDLPTILAEGAAEAATFAAEHPEMSQQERNWALFARRYQQPATVGYIDVKGSR